MSLKFDKSDRWASQEWIRVDAKAILDVSGPLPCNHLITRTPIYTAFRRWLQKTVKPETYEFILEDPASYSNTFLAYMNLAKQEAHSNKYNNNSIGADKGQPEENH